MSPVVVGMAVAALVGGLLLAIDGLLPRERSRRKSTGRSTGLWTTVDGWWTTRTRRQRTTVIGAAVGGLVAFGWTGSLVWLLAVPLVVLVLPALLSDPPNRDVEVLEALDRWVRALASSLPTGKSVTDAMRSTAPQAPALLQRPLRVMVARLDARWTTREALLALADDLDRPDADAVIAALVLAAERGGAGATTTLAELADSVQTRLRALREVEAERAKPRVVVRQVTVISVVVLAVAVTTQREFFRPYESPAGQVALAVLLCAYLGSLLMMRRMTVPRHRERILDGASPLAHAGVRRG